MWLWIAILAALAGHAWEFYLDFRQTQKLLRSVLPSELHSFVAPNKYRRMTKYSLSRLSFSRLESTYGLLAELAALVSRVFYLIWVETNAFLEHRLGFDASHQVLRGVVYIAVVSVCSALMKAPFELYRIFVIDGQFSQNTPRSALRWFWDQVKIFTFQIVIGGPLLAIVLFMLKLGATLHWFLIATFLAVVSIVLADVYPSLFAPMFHSFSPLDDPSLEAKIKAIAESMKITLKSIVLVDGSRRSGYSSAFMMGSGDSRTLVIYDTMKNALDEDELLAVVATELAHTNFGHPFKETLVQIASITVFLYLLHFVMSDPSFLNVFGFPGDIKDPAVTLMIFAYIYSSLGSFVNMLGNGVSRKFAYDADALAASLGLRIDKALIKLYVHNVQDIIMDKLYSRYYHNYPSLMERLDRLNLLKKKLT